jgi:hypothetical protein
VERAAALASDWRETIIALGNPPQGGTMSYRYLSAGILLLVLAACSKRSGSASDSKAQSPHVELKAMPMLPAVRAQLDSMARNPTMMHQEMAQHEAEVKHLVHAIQSDMTALGMHSDPAYAALADSVVRGSARLGTAGGAEFKRLVAEHIDQMRRLAAIYETKATMTQ